MKECECKRCGHKWNPRADNPTTCPKCKSYKWNEEKKELNKVEEI